MSDSTPAYIGVESCGCITAAQVDDGTRPKDVAKTIGRWIRDGQTVERTTVGEAKARPDFLPLKCPHNPKGWK